MRLRRSLFFLWYFLSLMTALTACRSRGAHRIVSTLESLLTPYVWGRYDALVLPSSFPYGGSSFFPLSSRLSRPLDRPTCYFTRTGMENPNMTFLTLALVVGDRSQVDVLAHECAHSWHGNSIGCADWDSFWLNEVRLFFLSTFETRPDSSLRCNDRAGLPIPSVSSPSTSTVPPLATSSTSSVRKASRTT